MKVSKLEEASHEMLALVLPRVRLESLVSCGLAVSMGEVTNRSF